MYGICTILLPDKTRATLSWNEADGRVYASNGEVLDLPPFDSCIDAATALSYVYSCKVWDLRMLDHSGDMRPRRV